MTAKPSLNEEMLLEALECGLSAPALRPEDSPLLRFRSLLEGAIIARLDVHEWESLKRLARFQDAARSMAQSGELTAAYKRSAEVWASLQRAQLSGLGRRIAKTLLVPVDAYLLYCEGRFEAARAALLEVSLIDGRIALSDGLPLLAVHRLQIAQNIMRIETRRGDAPAAASLGRVMLDHIFRRQPGPPGLLSPRILLDATPQEMRDHCYDKICAEIALAAGEGVGDIFPDLRAHAAFTRGEEGPRGRVLIAMALSRRAGRMEAFAPLAERLLAAGPSHLPELWLAAVLEAAAAARQCGRERTARVLLRKALGAGEVPDFFRLRLRRELRAGEP